jgi:hypothetical protein
MLGIISLLVGIPLSRSFMTIGVGLIFLNWVIDPKILFKLKKAFTNKLVLSFLGIILIHFIGLLWTEDFNYAAKDLRVKIPLLLLPLVFSTTKSLTTSQWRFIFKIFILAIVLATFKSMFILLDTGFFNLGNTRRMAQVISHIRFALNICIVIFIAIYMLVFPDKHDKYFKYWAIPVVIWLIVFLVILKALTGFVVLGFGLFFLSLYYAYLIRHFVFRFIVFMFILGGFLIVTSYIVKSYARYHYREVPVPEKLPKYTQSGNKYVHSLKNNLYENGHFVYAYISYEELKQEWNKISPHRFGGKDKQGQRIKHTLIRYLASKGLTKDSVGISKLTQKDIHAIENGFANYIYTNKFSIYASLYKIFWELERFKNGENPNGYSIVQRIYYIEAGLNIFKSSPLLGIGTGDVKKAFAEYYDKTKSVLSKERRLRSHNQYVTILLTFGVIGFVIFIWGLFYPILYKLFKKELNLPALIVFGVILLSMFNEDTMETQAGGLLVAFFYSFFVWGVSEKPIPGRKK